MTNPRHIKKIFQDAEDWVKQHYPEASLYKQAAFLNSVCYLCTGICPMETSGPSIREHLVSWSLAGDNPIGRLPNGLTVITPDPKYSGPGNWDFNLACDHAAAICFGPLSRQALDVIKQENVFDDDPEDTELVKRWVAEQN